MRVRACEGEGEGEGEDAGRYEDTGKGEGEGEHGNGVSYCATSSPILGDSAGTHGKHSNLLLP